MVGPDASGLRQNPIVQTVRSPQIPVLLSRRALREGREDFAGRGAPALEPIGVTYSMAQEVRWVDDDTFAIGRWDGTLTLFGPPVPPASGPRIESAAVSPAWAGLEMITLLGDGAFATSNDAASIALWQLAATGLARSGGVLRYDPAVGVANSGTVVAHGGREVLVTGHSSGTLLVWRPTDGPDRYVLERQVDVRSPDPVPSPYRLWNVRAVNAWRDALVLTGSEDGDLCLVDVHGGQLVRRVRFNPRARRGINDVALLGDLALVGSCSVGRDDSNTWAFALEPPDVIAPLAHVDLAADESREQVFNFSVELAAHGDRTLFFCATEEGLLWTGEVDGAALRPVDRLAVSSSLGAAVTLQRRSGVLAVVGDNIHLFRVPAVG